MRRKGVGRSWEIVYMRLDNPSNEIKGELGTA